MRRAVSVFEKVGELVEGAELHRTHGTILFRFRTKSEGHLLLICKIVTSPPSSPRRISHGPLFPGL